MNYYSRKEVANTLGCSATKVSNLVKKLPKEIKEKNIKVRKSKNGRDTWCISEEQVDLWKKEQSDTFYQIQSEKNPDDEGVFALTQVFSNADDIVTVSSRQIAKDYGKRHDKLLFEIERKYGDVIDKAHNGGPPLFIKHQYQHEQNNQWYPEYLCTRDGYSLLVMGFTGAKAIEWKVKYIEAFNKMKEAIENRKHHTPKNFGEALRMLAAKTEDKEKSV